MSCKYEKDIEEMLYGKLKEDKEFELLEHIKECDECSKRLKRIEHIDGMIKGVVLTSNYRDFRGETLKAVEEYGDTKHFRRFFYKPRRYLYALVVVLLAAVLLYSYGSKIYTGNPGGIFNISGPGETDKNAKYNIVYDKKSNFSLNVRSYKDTAQGYITGIDKGRFLIVGTNVNTEYNQLNATWISVPETDEVYKDLSIGTRVYFVSDGPTFTSYPGLGGIKITGIIGTEFPDAKSKERDIVRKGLEAAKDISGSDSTLYCINYSNLENGVWTLFIAQDDIAEKDGISYYKIKIQDGTQNIEETAIYN